VVKVGVGKDHVVDGFGIGGKRLVIAFAEFGSALEDAAIEEQALIGGLDEIFGAGDGAGGAEEREFGHRGFILQKSGEEESAQTGRKTK
jgi:hypothetical protein